MSLITDLISRYVPNKNIDTIKLPNNACVKQSVSSFLTMARAQFGNSAILCKCFTESLCLEPDFLKDEFLSTVIATNTPDSVYVESDEAKEALVCMQEFIDRLGGEITIAGRVYKGIELTDGAGRVYILVSNYIYPVAWLINGTGARPFMRRDHLPVPPPTDRYDVTFYNWAYQITGDKVSVWDLVDDLHENMDLCNSLYDVSSALIASNGTDFQSFENVVSSLSSSNVSVVRSLGSRVLAGWSTGGLYGVVRILMDFIRSPASASTDDEGHLVFTDNTTLVPSVYMAGVVTTVVTVVTTLASVIATIFSRIAGLALWIINSVVVPVITAPSYDYQAATTASMVDDFNVGYPMSPHGLSCYRTSVSGTPGYPFVSRMLEASHNDGPYGAMVPGGCYLFTFIDDQLSVEFHPDLVDRRDLVDTFVHWVNSVPSSESGSLVAERIIEWPATDDLISAIDHFEAQPLPITNNSLGVLSDADDLTLISVIIGNILLFYMNKLGSLGAGSLTSRFAYVYRAYKVGDGVWTDDSDCSYGGPDSMDVETFWRVFTELVYIYCVLRHSAQIGVNQHDLYAWNYVARFAQLTQLPGDDSLNSICVLYTSGSSLRCPLASLVEFDESYGQCFKLPYGYQFGILTPKYQKSGFFGLIIGVLLLAATVAIAATVTTIGVRKVIYSKRAKLAARAEQAWNQMVANPSVANAKAYRKAVRKNNWFTRFFGGDRLSGGTYWGSTDSGTSVVSKVGEQASRLLDENGNSQTNEGSYSLLQLKKLIDGISED